eukprot:scaffold76753_cov30-Tisochrysis_lutea.AAC.4
MLNRKVVAVPCISQLPIDGSQLSDYIAWCARFSALNQRVTSWRRAAQQPAQTEKFERCTFIVACTMGVSQRSTCEPATE